MCRFNNLWVEKDTEMGDGRRVDERVKGRGREESDDVWEGGGGEIVLS